MLYKNKIFYIAFVVAMLAINGCVKDNTITTPSLAKFAPLVTSTSYVGTSFMGSYFIKNDPNSVFKIPIGITTASPVDRNITYTVTSPTGAVSGQQYNLSSATSITIPAGKVVDSIAVKGLFAGYAVARKDSLIFTITGGDVNPFPTYNVYKLTMQKYCDVISTNLTGSYSNTKDYYAGSASASSYAVTVANWASTGATTATVLLQNFGATTDVGFGPFKATDPATTGITATLDWTDPANFKITIPSQAYVASLYSYGASTISGSGTFSACDQTFTISYTVKVAAGSFTGTSTIMKR